MIMLLDRLYLNPHEHKLRITIGHTLVLPGDD